MTQVCLLDSSRLSILLTEALSWDDGVSSLLVSAKNGSILAYAFKSTTPSIKTMRTKSTTMTAAYTAASESTLIYESQDTGAISVITPVADHVLLAVTGADPNETDSTPQISSPPHKPALEYRRREAVGDGIDVDAEEDDDRAQIRQDLESVSQELAGILKEELAGMKWPEDI